MKRMCAVIMIICVAVTLVGCDSLQKKFTRKKKETKPIPRLYQIKKYDIKPSVALYSKHYAYWQSWMSELLQDLGQNSKKDVRSVEEALNQARSMQSILVQEKADQLEKQIKEIEEAKDVIVREELSQFNKSQVLMTLERADRTIKRDFSAKKIKDYIRESFDDTPAAKASGASFSASMPSASATE